uniref:Uncharacterized protein n=1 Tax=Gopherus evgoodei TaxID=1825980 RepID=A0A8C4VQ99_9SAUR
MRSGPAIASPGQRRASAAPCGRPSRGLETASPQGRPSPPPLPRPASVCLSVPVAPLPPPQAPWRCHPWELAAKIIQTAWWSHIDRRLFRLLTHTIRAAEHCITYEIMRRVSPLEAELIKDPSMQCKVRFRFAGHEFPPFIVFKIFRNTGGQGSKYISGKRTISPASEAAVDACKLMGHRKYYDQMIWDELQYQNHKIIDEIDVATVKDYMQVRNVFKYFLRGFGNGKKNFFWGKKIDMI